VTAFTNSNDLIQPTNSGLAGRKQTASPVARVLRALEELPEHLRRYWSLYQTREQLSRLSDRSLSDIGIDRENIAKVAHDHHGQTVIRHDEIGNLLAMSDEELADIGVCRGDVEAYRVGRVKFLRRRLGGNGFENESAA
jgi:uncharacterized protein YjiS (DUF1127 family)